MLPWLDESDEDEKNEGDEGISIERIKISSTTVVMLKMELNRLGLSKTGHKHLLVKRLVNYYCMMTRVCVVCGV